MQASDLVQDVSDEVREKADSFKEKGNEYFAGLLFRFILSNATHSRHLNITITFAEGHYIQAVMSYTSAINLLPTAVYFGNRAFTYLKLENYGLAISDSDEAIRLDKILSVLVLKTRIYSNVTLEILDWIRNILRHITDEPVQTWH